MKIYVISRKGKLIDVIDRKIHGVESPYYNKVTYKGKHYLVYDMGKTNINERCIYPWGTGRKS